MSRINRIAKFYSDYGAFFNFIIFGITGIVCGFVALSINNKRLDYPVIYADVTNAEPAYKSDDVTKEYTLNIRYTVDGQDYEAVLYDMPEGSFGETTKIDYDPADPSQIGRHEAAWFPFIIIAIGVILAAVGVTGAVRSRKKNRQLKLQEEEWNNA